MNQIQATALPNVPLIEPGTDLAAVTMAGLAAANISLEDGDVLVYASKVVSKAEGRAKRLSTVQPSPAAKEIAQACAKDPRLVELILDEARQVIRIRRDLLIVEHRLGFISANAGVDHSNTGLNPDIVLLLPLDPDDSARRLRQEIGDKADVEIAVIINDSHGRAWRFGTVGVAIGVAGLLPLTDRRGQTDMFGRTLEATVLGTADEIAAAASLLQGGAAERSPIIHLRGVPYLRGAGSLSDMLRPEEMDVFR